MPLRFTLRQLEYFIAVGEAGSIALAAERVNVTAPSMSSAIAQLEAGFGVQLFTRRHAQGSALTPTGERFMEQARVVLEDAAKLNDLANIYTGSVLGSLRIGCLRTFVQLMVPQLRRTFESRYPSVEFSQVELDQAQIFDALGSARIDVALTYDIALPSDIDFQPLRTLPPYVMVDVDHPLAGRASLTADELLGHGMVLLDMPQQLGLFFVAVQGPRAATAHRGTHIGNLDPAQPRGQRVRLRHIEHAHGLGHLDGRQAVEIHTAAYAGAAAATGDRHFARRPCVAHHPGLHRPLPRSRGFGQPARAAGLTDIAS